VAGLLHLQQRFLADDRLVHQDVVEHTAGRIGIGGEDLPAGVRLVGEA